MKKRALVPVLCLLLLALLPLPARADTVLTGQWVGFTITTCTENGEYRHVGDLLVSYRAEGFDTMTFRFENTGNGEQILVAEHEMAEPFEGAFAFPAADYPYRDYRVTVEGKSGEGKKTFSVVFFSPDEYLKGPRDPGGDLTPPDVTISPVADRMLVTVRDGEGLAAWGDSLSFTELPHREFAGFYSPETGKRKTVSSVSEPIPYAGSWAYTVYAYDAAGNMAARTAFIITDDAEEMPYDVRYPEPAEPQKTAPNTADPARSVFCAVLLTAAALLLSRRKTG